MEWFEEQLKQRYNTEQADFDASLDSIIDSVIGKRIERAFEDREIAQSAIEHILNYYHHSMDYGELPPEVKTIDDQIAFYTRPFGITRRKVVLDQGWYRNASGAMLGTLKEDGSAVALIPNSFSGYSFINGITGKKTKLNRKTEKLLDKEALCFSESFPLKALTLKDLFSFMRKQLNRFDIIVYLGSLFLSTLLGMISPVISQWLFGNVLKSGSVTVLLAISGFTVCYAAGRILFEVYRTFISSRIETKWSVSVEAAVMNRMISMPASFFKQYSTGELTSRALNFRNLCLTMAKTVATTGFTAMFSLAYMSQIFLFAPALTGPSLLIILTTSLICIISVLVEMKYTEKNLKLSSELGDMTYSTISGIQKIKLAGAEKRMFTRWANLYAQQAYPPAFLKYNSLFSSAVTMIGTVAICYLAVRSNVGIANYYAFSASYGSLSGAFASLTSIVSTIALIKPTLNMAKPIMETAPEQTESKQRINNAKGAIEFSHVSFRYSDDMPNVIDDFSLKIKPGEYVAVVGSTGCGKSTLVRLILGFEKPQKGSVYFDRYDVNRINLESLRKNIGSVIQNGQLMYGDIYSNIVISSPLSTMEEAWEAAKLACIDEDIKAMPMGMFTMISEGQGGISGGQRQRLMIARALINKPKLLILDEATSALDNITQKKITEAIDKLNCTRLVIAHRLSTIQHADRILYLENGKIAEEGTYEQLIALNGRFANLVEKQRLN